LRPNRCIWTHGYYGQPIKSRHRPILWYHRWPSTTYRTSTIPHDWFSIVRYYPSKSFKVSDLHLIWKPVYDFLSVINSNLSPILHCLATIHPRQTDDRQTDGRQRIPIDRPLVKYGRLKTGGNISRLCMRFTRFHLKNKFHKNQVRTIVYKRSEKTIKLGLLWK